MFSWNDKLSSWKSKQTLTGLPGFWSDRKNVGVNSARKRYERCPVKAITDQCRSLISAKWRCHSFLRPFRSSILRRARTSGGCWRLIASPPLPLRRQRYQSVIAPPACSWWQWRKGTVGRGVFAAETEALFMLSDGSRWLNISGPWGARERREREEGLNIFHMK